MSNLHILSKGGRWTLHAQRQRRTRAHFQQEGVGAVQVEIWVISAIPVPQC